MRMTCFWVGLGCVIAAVAASACRGDKDGPGDQGGSGVGPKDEDHAKVCARNHPPFIVKKQQPRGSVQGKAPGYGAPTDVKSAVQPLVRETQALAAQPLLALVTGDCSDAGCGLNGAWLGAGVPFRTLHLSRFRHNDVNLSILGFQGPVPPGGGKRPSLTLQVDGDVLHAEGQPIVQPGSVLLLGPPETPSGPPSTPTYALTITKLHDEEFWVQNDCPSCTPETFPVYEFSATSLTDNCEVQVCAPDLDDASDRANNLIGTAVIFRGDYYDDAYTVRLTPPSTYDDDVFNIACKGTTLSKLHRLRHTSAATVTAADPPAPPVDRRQALLRMLTGDYCGAGHSFTRNRVPLHFGFDPALGFGSPASPSPAVILTSGSQFTLGTSFGATSLEAMWDGDGATCIGTPRLLGTHPSIVEDIKAACRLVNHHVVMPCPTPSGLPAAFAPPFALHSYLISENP